MRNLESGITAAPIDNSLSRSEPALLREKDYTFSDWKAYFQSIGCGEHWARKMALETFNAFALR